MIDLSILDDATIWVAISFFIFFVLIFKPIKSQISSGLDQKTAKELLINGFLLDVVEKITDEETKKLIKKMIGLN